MLVHFRTTLQLIVIGQGCRMRGHEEEDVWSSLSIQGKRQRQVRNTSITSRLYCKTWIAIKRQLSSHLAGTLCCHHIIQPTNHFAWHHNNTTINNSIFAEWFPFGGGCWGGVQGANHNWRLIGMCTGYTGRRRRRMNMTWPTPTLSMTKTTNFLRGGFLAAFCCRVYGNQFLKR